MDKRALVLFISFFILAFLSFGFLDVVAVLAFDGVYTKDILFSLAGWPKYLAEDIIVMIGTYIVYRNSKKKVEQKS